ncbi:SIS domain-containing protein [Rhodobacteraceae bacterium CCMM004]|nr:SIS domain-containing protein [Rhodobacteraceae bacterium CCMM004]
MAAGCGREALQLRGLVMRLHHLGLSATMQGDLTAPPLGPGDLLIASAGPGHLATVAALVDVARGAGAATLLLTAVPDAPLGRRADAVLHIPAQTMATDRQAPGALPMGSVYEGALFVLGEVLVDGVRRRRGTTPADMRARHTNME